MMYSPPRACCDRESCMGTHWLATGRAGSGSVFSDSCARAKAGRSPCCYGPHLEVAPIPLPCRSSLLPQTTERPENPPSPTGEFSCSPTTSSSRYIDRRRVAACKWMQRGAACNGAVSREGISWGWWAWQKCTTRMLGGFSRPRRPPRGGLPANPAYQTFELPRTLREELIAGSVAHWMRLLAVGVRAHAPPLDALPFV